jgi:hypothetical protein
VVGLWGYFFGAILFFPDLQLFGVVGSLGPPLKYGGRLIRALGMALGPPDSARKLYCVCSSTLDKMVKLLCNYTREYETLFFFCIC